MKTLFAILLLVVCVLVVAQTPQPLPDTGYPEGASYDAHDFDVVDMNQFNVHIGLSLLKQKVRTGSFSLDLDIDSHGLSLTGDCDYMGNCEYLIAEPTPMTFGGNISFGSMGYLSTLTNGYFDVDACTVGNTFFYMYHNVIAVDPHGAVHSFLPEQTCLSEVSDVPRRYAWDGSGLLYNTPNGIAGTGAQVHDPRGGFYDLADSNGNTSYTVTTRGNDSCNSPTATVYQDDSGRTYTVTRGNCSTVTSTAVVGGQHPTADLYTETYTYVDANGVTQQIVAHFRSDYVNHNLCQYEPYTADPLPFCQTWIQATFLTEIDLPNGRQYTFTYATQDTYPQAPYGQLFMVTLPTGGVIRYDWSPINYWPWEDLFPDDANNITITPQNLTPYLSARTEMDANGNVLGVSHYYNFYPVGPGNYPNIMVDANGNETDYYYGNSVVAAHYTNGGMLVQSPYGAEGIGQAPYSPLSRAAKTSAFSCNRFGYACVGGAVWTGTPLRQDISSGPDSASGYYTTNTAILGNGYQSQVVKAYATYTDSNVGVTMSWGNPTDVKEYDFGNGGPGALLRETLYGSYLNLNPNQPSYFTQNLADLYSSKTVLDGNGNVVAESVFGYDGQAVPYCESSNCTPYPLVSTSSVCLHDYNNYSQSNSVRGNLTMQSDWVSGNSWVTKQFQYDDTGRLVTQNDPLLRATAYDYTDQFSNGAPSCGSAHSFVTTVTNALGQQQFFHYFFGTGALSSKIDENSQITTYSYDLMGALTQVQYPTTGIISYNYNGYSLPFTVTKTVQASPDPSIVTNTVHDALGRPVQSQLASDPEGPIYTQTTYDGVGQVQSVSNPYRSTSDVTYGITTYGYDALGRKIKQTDADGSVQQWCYDGIATAGQTNCRSHIAPSTGEWVDFADENGNDWQKTTDALGRLTSVVEPNGSSAAPSMETDYTYNALNDLLLVKQWGGPYQSLATNGPLTRSFGYDGLSRLLTSNNPETGAVSYTYPVPGPFCGAGDVSLPCTKTDARGIAVTYAYEPLNRLIQKSASDSSFTDNYYYDWTSSNWSSITNSIGRLSYSTNNVNAAEVHSYDAMGQQKNEWYWTPQNPNWNTTVAAVFDQAGALNSLAYPDGRVVSQSYDGAGRLSTVNYASWGGNNVGTPYLTVNTYDAAGHLTSGTMGSGTAITAAFNPRLERTSLSYGPSLSPIWSRQFTWQPNGNLQQTTDPMYGTRQYGYDTLNRLISAQGGGLQETYNYDPFGNLKKSGPPFSFQPTTFKAANQPLPTADWSFDLAGNLTRDAVQGVSYTWNGDEMMTWANSVNYTYDAEGNRVGKSGSTPADTIYFGGQPLARFAGSAWTDLISGGGGTLAEVSSTSPNNPTYRMTDHLGSGVGTLSSSGTPLQDYGPWGELMNGSTTSDPYKFTGKERDTES